MSSGEELRQIYDKDPKTPCKYGDKCYQKNEAHRNKFKHPPVVDQRKKSPESNTKKRTWLDRKEDEEEKSKSLDGDSDSELPEAKKPCVSEKTEEVNSPVQEKTPTDVKKKDVSDIAGHSKSKVEDEEAQTSTFVNERQIIKEKFLVEMPEDFYEFYEFCKEMSPKDPSNAFKAVNLLLVGPYDILNGKLLDAEIDNEEQYLSHWRYFYDPPEFQTIIKGNDKEGLHFGYWRDEPKENPVFVAKNSANIDCKIKPLAETIFGAIEIYLEERLKSVTPFEKPKFSSLRLKLRKYAISKDVRLDKSTESMRARERRVVARTFHGAGIVVPYNKKTQLGYRELAVTDANLKQILKRINEAKDDDQRNESITHLEEVERLATIAADECDFGTCLEFGHDLFSNGSKHVQSTAIRMLSTAYTHLNRLEFLKIIKAHCKNRKEGSALGIV